MTRGIWCLAGLSASLGTFNASKRPKSASAVSSHLPAPRYARSTHDRRPSACVSSPVRSVGVIREGSSEPPGYSADDDSIRRHSSKPQGLSVHIDSRIAVEDVDVASISARVKPRTCIMASYEGGGSALHHDSALRCHQRESPSTPVERGIEAMKAIRHTREIFRLRQTGSSTHSLRLPVQRRRLRPLATGRWTPQQPCDPPLCSTLIR